MYQNFLRYTATGKKDRPMLSPMQKRPQLHAEMLLEYDLQEYIAKRHGESAKFPREEGPFWRSYVFFCSV